MIQPGEGVVRVGGDSKVGRKGSKLDGSKLDDGEVDGIEVKVNEVGKKIQKMSKS